MKIFMTGGTGFIGTFLTKIFTSAGNTVTILTQPVGIAALKLPGLSYLEGTPTVRGKWQDVVKEQDVIINLAGASIFSRWTAEKKTFCGPAASTPHAMSWTPCRRIPRT
jgi:hypothetical protein